MLPQRGLMTSALDVRAVCVVLRSIVLDKRYALVVYRDEGHDEDFVTRTFDFTDDVGD